MTVSLVAGVVGSGGDAEGDTLTAIERAYGSDFDDTIAGNDGANLLRGYNGSDTLIGGGGNDNLQGGVGSDIFVFEGNSGHDLITDFTDGEDSIEISGIESFADLQALFTQSGNDVVISLSSADSITLSNTQVSDLSADDFDGLTDPDMYLPGTEGRDVLIGGSGNDTISGRGGNDTIHGAGGNDSLNGGLGSDEFIFNPGDGHDVIYNFDPYVDIINAGGNYDDLFFAIEVNGSIVFDYGNDDSLTLYGVDFADFPYLEDFDIFV